MGPLRLRRTKMIVKIEKRQATLTEAELITSGSVGISIRFEFDREWEGLGKIAVFRGYESADQLIDGNECIIPWEILEHSGQALVVGVYGATNDGHVVIPTVFCSLGIINTGAIPADRTVSDATPGAVAQMLAAAERSEEAATRAEQNAYTALQRAGDALIASAEALTKSEKAMDTADSATQTADDAKQKADEVYGAYTRGELKGGISVLYKDNRLYLGGGSLTMVGRTCRLRIDGGTGSWMKPSEGVLF